MQKKFDAKTFSIGLKLLLICAIVAGIISSVYSLTADRYRENIEAEKRRAIMRIFDTDSLTYTPYDSAKDAAVYRVDADGALLGYCVEVASPGFGGDLSLMVGFDAQRMVIGVSVISHSETPGLGSLVTEDAFLSQFDGVSGIVTPGAGVDTISGATISSRAVIEGVNLAVEQLALTLGGEAE